MSFWDNNKDSFKSAGKSTFKGITSGTKAVGQAGYRTYKKNEAKRKGVEYHDPIKMNRKAERQMSLIIQVHCLQKTN